MIDDFNDIDERDIEKFLLRVDDRAGPKGCWPYIGYLNDRNNPQFNTLYWNKSARVLMWYLVYGQWTASPIVMTCGNKQCLNPAHFRQRFKGPYIPKHRSESIPRKRTSTGPGFLRRLAQKHDVW